MNNWKDEIMLMYATKPKRGRKKLEGTKYERAKERNVAYLSGPSGKSYHLNREALSKFNSGTFCSLDSEGVTDENGIHRTVLFAASTGEYIADENGLSQMEILDYLVSLGKKYDDKIFVIYGGSYDCNMILKGIGYENAQEIWNAKGKKWVFVNEYYVVKYVPRREIHIAFIPDRDNKWARCKNRKEKEYVKLNHYGKIVIYDVLGFFQGSFIDTVEKMLGKDYPDLDLIREGKKARHIFSKENMEFILGYTQAELRALDLIMDKIRAGMRDAGLVISRWYGAGAVAAAMLKKEGAKQHISPLPDEVYQAALHGYFGGRIELMKYGTHKGKIYHYDIASAYPSIMMQLPSLSSGEWVHHADGLIHPENLTIYHIKWRSRLVNGVSFGPFPFREKNGAVVYPDSGEGWYWSPEVIEAKRHSINTIEIIESFEWIPHENIRPFEWILSYYEKRKAIVAEIKRTGILNALEHVLKLGLSSCYGKTAQTLGGREDKPPPYHNFAYAGYITSGTRAKLYAAGMKKPGSIICFCTDGVFSTSPLDLVVTKTKELGLWEEQFHDEMIVLQAGFYWLRDDDIWRMQSRGVSKPEKGKAYSYAEKVLQAWDSSQNTVAFPATRFITLGTALSSCERFGLWCRWIDEEKEIKTYVTGTKRDEIEQVSPRVNCKRLRNTVPKMDTYFDKMSTPFDPKWSSDESETTAIDDEELSDE